MKKIQWMIWSMMSLTASAQDYVSDPVRFLRPEIGGTARSMGVAGAFSSVGADMSCMSSNPAGIGLYRSSELSISMGAKFGTDNTAYLGSGSTGSFSKFNFNHIGGVFTTRDLSIGNRSAGNMALKRIVFGINYQKEADFDRSVNFSGSNTHNSQAQNYADVINNTVNGDLGKITFDNFATPVYQAWQTYVADTFITPGKVDARTPLPVYQSGRVATSGGMHDINMTLGFNVGDKLFIGVGLGIPYLSYKRTIYMTETNKVDSAYYFTSYNTIDDYKLSGLGVNGKLGVIYKPTAWVRLGAAIQTPTGFGLTEVTNYHTDATIGKTNYSVDTSATFDYTFIQPLKATFGASFYGGKWGFVSVDYELNDYPHSSYRFPTAPSEELYWNNRTGSEYRVASTVKAGAEFSFKSLRVRGGFAWSQSPLKATMPGYDGARYTGTVGLGYRGTHFYADAAYAYNQYKDYYMPYITSTNQPISLNTATYHALLFTVGYRFGGK
jgi:hypothetical protein